MCKKLVIFAFMALALSLAGCRQSKTQSAYGLAQSQLATIETPTGTVFFSRFGELKVSSVVIDGKRFTRGKVRVEPGPHAIKVEVGHSEFEEKIEVLPGEHWYWKHEQQGAGSAAILKGKFVRQ